MTTEETLELIRKLRAEGVTRVEFDDEKIAALDFGAVPDEGGTGSTTPDADATSAPFEAAIKQMRAGRFRSGEAS